MKKKILIILAAWASVTALVPASPVFAAEEVQTSTDMVTETEESEDAEDSLVQAYAMINSPSEDDSTAESDEDFIASVEALIEKEGDSDYEYEGENTFVSINKVSTDTSVYHLTHILIKDASQIKGGLSYDDYGGTRQAVTAFATEKDAVVATNGSYFSYDTGQPACAAVFIKNGEIMVDGTSNGKELCLTENGRLFTPVNGETASQLLAEGVVEIWGTADPLLIQDGEKVVSDDTAVHPRTFIGEALRDDGKLEYYIIVADGRQSGYSIGLSNNDMAEIMEEKGCSIAYNLDGGGSSTMVFDHKLLNKPSDGQERWDADFLYLRK